MRRIKLSLARDLKVDFVDRDLALRRVEEWSEKSTYPVQVIYGPEGCGKTAWLRQSVELLRELGFDVIYLNPIERIFLTEVGIEDVRRRLNEVLHEATDEAWVKATWLLIDLARSLIKAGRRRVAIIVDDVFSAIGLSKAAMYVKGMLGLIEYPPRDYDVIITVAATSEGLSRREIGRHRWADLMPMWNMSKEGFKQLYNQIPGNKLPFEEAWRLTGGNPLILGEFYKAGWNIGTVVGKIIDNKRIEAFIASLSTEERHWLEDAVNDPDTLLTRERMQLMDRLVELNLLIDVIPERDSYLWIDHPPLRKDLGLGIGEHNAWQTPLHREAVKRVLERFNRSSPP
ncbi:ATP-binding protein [Caldivirga sp. UBA161]|uniref:ATP-binding protein n=1 Tax=Caldivirga sp. UBA161 TaxID=1915569 RepID=UPI0025B8FCDD|nr:ATP-binding protein [Caldivirga sp. UBA161]